MKTQTLKKVIYIVFINFSFLFFSYNYAVCTIEVNAPASSEILSYSLKPKIIVGGSFDFPPYSFIDENGYPSGFVSDLTREIAKALDVDVEFRLDKWALVLDNLKNKKIDCIQDIFFDKKRDEIYDFSTSYIDVTYAIITKKGVPPLNVEGLKNKSIIINNGDLSYTYLKSNNITDKIIMAQTYPECLLQLKTGKYDCTLLQKLTAIYWMEKFEIKDLTIHNSTVFPNKLCYAVPEGNTELIGKINEALIFLKKNGTYLKLHNKWFGFYDESDKITKQIISYIEFVMAPLLILIFLILMWNRSLKKLVASKTIQLQKQYETLKESEYRYSLLSQITHEFICELDMSANYVYVNISYEKVAGYSRDELIGKSVFDIFHPDEVDTMKESLKKMMEDKKPVSGIRYRAKFKNNDWHWLESAYNFYQTMDGEWRLVATSRDFTETKNFTEKLIKLSSEQKIIFDSVPACIWFKDANNNFVRVNKSAAELVKMNVDDIEGKSAYLMFDKDMAEKYHSDDLEVINTGQPKMGIIEQVKDSDGCLKWIHTDKMPYIDETGNCTGIVAFSVDITAKKQIEDTLSLTQNKLFRLYNNMADGFASINMEGKFIEFNESFRKMLGYEEEELKNMNYIQVTPESWHEKEREILDTQVLVNGYSDIYEKEYIRKDGTILPVEIRTYILADNDKTLGLWGIVRDISERKKAEAMILQTKKELERKVAELQRINSELEQFAYVSSHDLKEPLRMIASYSQLLSERYKGKLDEKADKYIKYVIEGVLRMQTLINDLLTYSRVDTTAKNLKIVDIAEVITKTIQNLKVLIEENKAVINFGKMPFVLCDQTLIIQLFQNLIQNAIKFKGPNPPLIDIKALKRGNMFEFILRDNGIGIAKEFYERVFIIFQRLHTRENYQGNGIGLAVCKKIVEKHGGRIWIESETGAGTTFYFTIPADNS